MNLTSKPLAVIIFVFMFGGIALTSALGWWQTESTKEPAAYTEGEFAGQANPADIRGSYTFGDVANSFNIAPEILAQAFQVTDPEPATFAVKNLETMYLDSGYEIGTNSVRLFVAFSLGLPFDTTGQEIYLPKTATEILLAQNTLAPEQIAYLESYTVDVKPATTTEGEVAPAPQAESTPAVESAPTAATSSEESEYVVKGKTIFGDLTGWGVPQTVIEQIIGAPMPNPAMTVKDYASANGLDFEAIKTQLQAEVDKVKPK
ncbi:MAG: hypothetical protein PHQ36_10260 [Anaerolineales bacterium]|nr:hypothetical protein [Anaerolineales bacterium]